MSDLALIWDNAANGADLELLGADLATEDGLRTAIIISLFSDRLARPDDALPDDSGDRRGWWADAFPEAEGDQIGSRLWLLDRAKQLPETLDAANDYATEALQWLVEDGVAQSVTVTAEWTQAGLLGAQIEVARPTAPAARFFFVWEATA